MFRDRESEMLVFHSNSSIKIMITFSQFIITLANMLSLKLKSFEVDENDLKSYAIYYD